MEMISSISCLWMVFFCFDFGEDALRTGFIQHVDGLVGQVAVVDESRRQLSRAGDGSSAELHAMVLLEARLQAFEDLDGLLDRWLGHIYLLDHALSRRFQKVDVPEPSVEQTIEILKGLKSRFEEHHSVKFSAAAITSAAELSARFINDRHLPDKAIDVLDEAGAAQRILPKSKQKKTIGKHEIEEIISKIARIPARTVSHDDRNTLKTLERDLKSVVFGQNAAIDALSRAIKMSRSGLGNPQKPIGSFLFSGPTGVGKTEVARQLAYIMGMPIHRFDMSEYMERHAVSRLIGAPPGYVGFEQGGLLTEAITKQPHCVLLLDEIEKAHPDIFNILLQVMDHGTLTDNNGRKADFRNVVIIMTTNAGAEAMNKVQIGFTKTAATGDEMADIKRLFTPEFRNRLDAIISFATSGQGSHPARGRQIPDAAGRATAREEGGSCIHRCAQGLPGRQGLRPADGRTPDVAPDSGHHSLQRWPTNYCSVA